MKVALFPGSFDPFTRGHENIVNRALRFMDKVVIGIGVNDAKHALFTVDERVEMIRGLYAQEPRVQVLSYSGLTVDVARQLQADVILRGVRSVKDFEYEQSIADINRQLTGVDTLLLYTEPQLSSVSSSVVRELYRYGQDIARFLPQGIVLPHEK